MKQHTVRRWVPAFFLAFLLLAAAGMLSACGSDDDTPTPTVRLPDFTGIVKAVGPAVVNISTVPAAIHDQADGDRPAQPNPFEDWLRRFFEEGPSQPGPAPRPDRGPGAAPHPSLGSGFIISDDGYILTNRHVVQSAGQIVVKLNDRRQLLANIVRTDSYSDLALLKVDAQDLPTVEIGSSKALQVGSWVLAIGSPFGFETSVTAGIVSAKRRNLASDQYVPFIQTDVAINPGNSGGPLFNLSGEVVGINSQIYSRTGGYQGVSFAIPIDIAMDVARQLRENGEVERGWLGVQIQDVDRELAESFGLKRPEGALVARVLADSPAAAAGLEPGAIILAFNEQPVTPAAVLPPLVGTVPAGDTATVMVMRGGERLQIPVEIEALPQDLMQRGRSPVPEEPAEDTRINGLTLEELSDQARDELGLSDDAGVEVVAVDEGAGARAGLQPGDIILAVGREQVGSVAALREYLGEAEGPVALLVLREGNRLYLALRSGND